MSNPVPVTVVTSSLGADSSRALNTLLRDTGDLRVTAIVPRRGHKRSRGQEVVTVIPTTEKLVRLGQGCACCTVRGDLMSKVQRIADQATADHIIIHAGAHADLATLAQTFTVANASGAVLSDAAHIESLVTVIDARSLFATLLTESARPLIERIELANVLFLEGVEDLSGEEATRVEGVVRALNPEARVVRSDDRDFALASLRSERPFDLTLAEQRASRMGSPDRELEPSGTFVQFTYFERAPFHPERLYALLSEPWPGVLRVQGSFWVASRPDFLVSLDVAGGSRFTSCEGRWWASVPAAQRPTSPRFQEYLNEIWHPEFGDRQQALTIVGTNVDQAELQRMLERCLLTEEELADPSAWPSMPHPFPWPTI